MEVDSSYHDIMIYLESLEESTLSTSRLEKGKNDVIGRKDNPRTPMTPRRCRDDDDDDYN